MSLLKNENGFTLIEVLVGINIALITVTIIISFYLFSSRFITSVSTSIVGRNELSTCLQKASEMLESTDCFDIKYNNTSCKFMLPSSDSITIYSNKISVKNIYNVEDISEAGVRILYTDGEENAIFIKDTQQAANEDYTGNTVSSGEIKSITISFIKDKNRHSVCCTLPYIADRRFRNISENENSQNFR